MLQGWAAQTAPLDMIIDDGAHTNAAILSSFHELWPVLKPRGLYFVEDMQVLRTPDADDHPDGTLVWSMCCSRGRRR